MSATGAQRFLRRPEVEALVGLSRARIYQKVAQGTFPAPIKISDRAVAWSEASIINWQEERIAASDLRARVGAAGSR
jgi:prophage regulatory protein